ncbi:hypothetical protein C1701_06215 [Actinoalloteichus sp. AHMU CJ021]|uniref:HAAS signaling domain-containing protein n=1 Tax=Actinoalloteichus sp. AHMU CJ021 TaxID=2072503 RepID=UPI000CA06291|nr:hypothetical protein C1701_06215 [Actinoalloteichus sp. AHMU CJ021]
MPARTQLPAAAVDYRDRVAAGLRGLGEPEREEVLEDVELNLAEVVAELGPDVDAERLESRMGPPERYARELLAAGGYSAAGQDAPRRRLPVSAGLALVTCGIAATVLVLFLTDVLSIHDIPFFLDRYTLRQWTAIFLVVVLLAGLGIAAGRLVVAYRARAAARGPDESRRGPSPASLALLSGALATLVFVGAGVAGPTEPELMGVLTAVGALLGALPVRWLARQEPEVPSARDTPAARRGALLLAAAASSSFSPVAAFAVRLQPGWWLIRAVLLGWAGAVLTGSGVLGVLVATALLLPLSVVLGERSKRDRRLCWVAAPLNGLAVGLFCGLLAVAVNPSPSTPIQHASHQQSAGWVLPESGNILPFDRNGELLDEVYLFDGSGNPIELAREYCTRYGWSERSWDNLFPRPEVEILLHGECVERPVDRPAAIIPDVPHAPANSEVSGADDDREEQGAGATGGPGASEDAPSADEDGDEPVGTSDEGTAVDGDPEDGPLATDDPAEEDGGSGSGARPEDDEGSGRDARPEDDRRSPSSGEPGTGDVEAP